MPPFAPLPDAPRERRSAPQIPRDLAGDRDGPEEPSPADEGASAEPPSPDPAEDVAEPPGEAPEPPPPPASDPAQRLAAPPAEPAGLPHWANDPLSEAPASPGPAAPSTGRPASRPVLASEALMEDLAPVEPLRQQARVLCVISGLVFALLGALPLLGLQMGGRAALVPAEVVGAVTLFAAVAHVTYRQRAVAMVALGAIVAILGIAGMGPARGIAHGGALWSVAQMVAAAALPATLLFRARYRAFEGARMLLGLGFLAALPFAVHAVLLLVDPGATFGFVQLGAVLALAFVVAGLPGFMGSETTAAGTFVAPAMIAAFALSAGLHRIGALVPGSLGELVGLAQAAAESAQATVEEGEALRAAPSVTLPAAALLDAVVTTIAVGVSALLSAVGLFQILSWKFAPVARRIDVRKATEAALEDRPSVEDWSTRH